MLAVLLVALPCTARRTHALALQQAPPTSWTSHLHSQHAGTFLLKEQRNVAVRACLVVAAALVHGLELWPGERLVAVLVHLPDHVLHLRLHAAQPSDTPQLDAKTHNTYTVNQ